MRKFIIATIIVCTVCLSACQGGAAEPEKTGKETTDSQPQTQTSTLTEMADPTVATAEITEPIASTEDATVKATLDEICMESVLPATEGDTLYPYANIAVSQKRTGNTVDGKNNQLSVYVLAEYQDNSYMHRTFLVVETDNDMLSYDLNTKSLQDTLYLVDIDADGLDEIILHQHLDDFGGAGSYISRIYQVEDGRICEMFNSYTSTPQDSEDEIFDTGFSSEFIEGKKLKITNQNTDYQTILDVSERYIDEFFDSAGKGPSDLPSGCDSFISFEPNDVDEDGVFEIIGTQYMFVFNHAGGIGYGKTVLKYNAQNSQFEVIKAEFSTEYPA